MASTAVSKEAKAVMTMTPMPGCRRRISGSMVSPDSACSHRSRKTTSKRPRSSASSAPAAVPTPKTRALSTSRQRRSDWRTPGSSSMISADQAVSMNNPPLPFCLSFLLPPRSRLLWHTASQCPDRPCSHMWLTPLLLERNYVCRFVVAKQIAKTRPQDEGVEDFFVVLMWHTHDDRLQNKLPVHVMRRLPLKHVVDFPEEVELEELGSPDGLALLLASLDEPLSFRFKDNRASWGIDEVQHFGGLDNGDHPPELPVGIAGDTEDVLLAAPSLEVFQQTRNLTGGCLGQELDEPGLVCGGDRW